MRELFGALDRGPRYGPLSCRRRCLGGRRNAEFRRCHTGSRRQAIGPCSGRNSSSGSCRIASPDRRSCLLSYGKVASAPRPASLALVANRRVGLGGSRCCGSSKHQAVPIGDDLVVCTTMMLHLSSTLRGVTENFQQPGSVQTAGGLTGVCSGFVRDSCRRSSDEEHGGPP